MASSFISQVPAIINLIKGLHPKSVLDIGKGFGKYGFLVHEYIGIDNTLKIDPSKSMLQLSSITIDACEADIDLMLPHLSQIYQTVFTGDVLEKYQGFKNYDLILMIDVIEHLEKAKAEDMLKYFVSKGTTLIIATPAHFFEQNLYESEFEHHVSHWTLADFKRIGCADSQKVDAGMIYLLSSKKIDIRGFGSSLIKKIRRVARAVKNEF